MAENNLVNQEYSFENDEEFDFENLEIPQLIRRNGIINDVKETVGFIILEKPADKIFVEEQCPICLESSSQLYPLKCGHTFCQYDIEKMMDLSKSSYSLMQCPICRAYQTLESFDEVSNLKLHNLDNFQQLCN